MFQFCHIQPSLLQVYMVHLEMSVTQPQKEIENAINCLKLHNSWLFKLLRGIYKKGYL
jgi:hypothetical protein